MARPGQVLRLLCENWHFTTLVIRCVDFSKTVDFAHLRTKFNLSSGSKPGLCAHGTSGLEDCCHCLRLMSYSKESTTGPYSIDLSRFYNDFHCILSTYNGGKHFIQPLWFQVLLLELSTSLIQSWCWKGSQIQFSKMRLKIRLTWQCWKVCLVN